MLFALKIDFKIDACLQLQDWKQILYICLGFMGEARNFSSWGDAHSHGLTILKMWRLLLLPPCYNAPRHKQKIFPVTPTEEEIASRRTVGWAATEAAELGHALNNLWPWAGRQDGSLTDLGRGLGERSNPTCAYSNTPSFSVFLPPLPDYFLYNYIQEKDREDPSRTMLFYLQSPSHPHSCQKDTWLGEPTS